MTRVFPIRLDAEIKHIPFGVMEPHEARCVKNHGKGLQAVSMQGGLTPEEAVAILEDRPFERMAMTGATLRLKQLVEEWKGRNMPPMDKRAHSFGERLRPHPDGPAASQVNLANGRALHALQLSKSLRDGRRVVNKANWNELITALEGLVELTR